MIEAPATKAELLEWVTASRSAWEELLADLHPADMEIPGVVGKWSIKDLVAHITWSEKQMVGMLKDRALVGSELWELGTDERNQVVYQQNKGRLLEEVLSEAQYIYTQLLSLLKGLNEPELYAAAYFKNMPPDWLPWRIIAGNTYLHYQEHSQDVQAWLADKTPE
ncbi:MAG: ClbS/DfsB family four-helix bundle protein [Anaerolineales bacterium]|nr:MAG: ClbS/DfsB family four-helix bundle protein [Anaerolineales bacterium]